MEDTVSPPKLSRTSFEVAQAMDEIKESIRQDGFYSISEYKALTEKYGNVDEALEMLVESGFTVIKTNSVNPEVSQEVIVDVRYIAAAMLLIYADPVYAKQNSVLTYLQHLHQIGTWTAARPMVLLPSLLGDIYRNCGHFFTISDIAENADLSQEDAEFIVKMASRHRHAMYELSKSDSELTRVFEMCVRVMAVVNENVVISTGMQRKKPGSVYVSDVCDVMSNTKAYGHFRRFAIKILDKHRKKMRKQK